MKMKTEITGLPQLAQVLHGLSGQVQGRLLREAVAAGAEVVRAEAEERAPYYEGKVGPRHPPPGTLKASVFKARLPEECNDMREVWQVNVKRRYAAFYAHFVEYGTVKMSKRPFMRPAWEAKKKEAREVMVAKLAELLQRVKKKAV